MQTQNRTTLINTTFWNQLNHKVDTSHTPEDATLANQSGERNGSSTEEAGPSSAFLFGHGSGIELNHVSDTFAKQRPKLLHVFFARVHPICRILHQPTALEYMNNIEDIMIENTQRLKHRSLEAVYCAITFTAVKTLTAAECLDELGEHKNVIEPRLRHNLESALAACDLPNTREIVTLQAFTLYIVRILSSWNLVPD